MVKFRFQYRRIQNRLEPIIPIGIQLGNDWQRIYAYVDSGATYTVLQSRVATQLGFDYQAGNLVSIQVGNGSLIRVYVHDLEVQVGTERLTVPVGFSDQLGVPMNVLGKMGFFDHFAVCFHQPEQFLTFERFRS